MLTPQDYAVASDCKQVSFDICGHHYIFWCKEGDLEKITAILDKIRVFVEKTNIKNKSLSFDKVLLMSFVEKTASEIEANAEDLDKKVKYNEEQGKKASIVDNADFANEIKDKQEQTETMQEEDRKNYVLQLAEKDKKISELEKSIEKNEKRKSSIIEELKKLKTRLEECYKRINISN